jgi:hypothetical protein
LFPFGSPIPLPVAALPAVRLTAHTPAKLYKGGIFVSYMTTGRIGRVSVATDKLPTWKTGSISHIAACRRGTPGARECHTRRTGAQEVFTPLDPYMLGSTRYSRAALPAVPRHALPGGGLTIGQMVTSGDRGRCVICNPACYPQARGTRPQGLPKRPFSTTIKRS